MIDHDGTIQILDSGSPSRPCPAIYEVTRNGRAIKNGIVQVPRLQILDWIFLRKSGVKVKLPPDDERNHRTSGPVPEDRRDALSAGTESDPQGLSAGRI